MHSQPVRATPSPALPMCAITKQTSPSVTNTSAAKTKITNINTTLTSELPASAQYSFISPEAAGRLQ